MWALLRRQGKGGAKKFDEGGLAGILAAQNQYAARGQLGEHLEVKRGRRGSLEGSWVFAPPHAARAVDADGADGAARIAVAAAVGHALGTRVGVVVHVRGRGGGHGWHRHGEGIAGGGRHPVVERGPAEVGAEVGAVAAHLVGDNGNRVGAGTCIVVLGAAKVVDLG